jgi:cytochrome c553
MTISAKSILLTIVIPCVLASNIAADDTTKQRGAKIFAEQCAGCHGKNGAGTPDNYPKPLFGDKPTIDLAEGIAATMPEGEAELCVGDDAAAVAEWMQAAFYSPEAQARINPPRTKLSRLTVTQYRNCVTDLIESFTRSSQPDDRLGLTARYYKSRRFRDQDKVIERVDPVINFDFGEATPDAEKIPEAEEFSIRWEGSLIVNETGWYDFAVKTENGGRLFVNDPQTALIDAWVKSGYDTEYRSSLFLLAGRIYPLRLEWFTFKEKTASVGLWWKPPHGIDQPIPARHLSPQSSTQLLIIETPFPPDDRSDGYVRGTSVSREWDEATTFAAIEAVDRLWPMLQRFVPGKNSDERDKRLQQFCAKFAKQAFRRPLSEQERNVYVDAQFESAATAEDAVRRSVLAVLKSPRFLYREVSGQNDSFTKASRLSFALTDSLPDRDLLQAAEKGQLDSDKGLREQARRLVNSYRGQIQLHRFLRVWLNLDRLDDIGKDAQVFPNFTPDFAADLRASLELLLDEAVSRDEGGFQTLLTSDETWVNDRMAAFYSIEQQEDHSGFRKVKFEPELRAGIVSHPYLLSGLAYQNTSSPIHRGVFLSRGILGRALKPPPDSVSPLPPDLAPDLTTRERVGKQTSPAMCAGCHKMINSLGFALEEFDAVGRHRETEKDRQVDVSGHYRLRTGETAEFNGANELAGFLVQSDETHRSFARQLFHHMVQQPILAYGPQSIDQLAQFFADHQLNMQHLMVEIACRAAEHEQH